MPENFDQVSKAFTLQSDLFDEYEESNIILKWMRSVTHKHLLRNLRMNDTVLELNCVTRIDALFLAKNGFIIHSTDIAEGMLKKLSAKIVANNLSDMITYQKLSFTQLDKLLGNKYDYIFSNFGSLNCSENLREVFKYFSSLLKPGGRVTLVIIPPICPREISHSLTGKFKTAFRRFNRKGVNAIVEGIKFRTYHYSAGQFLRFLGKDFRKIELQGLASVSPPPYMINFPKRFTSLYKLLTKTNEFLSHTFPFNRWADHFILTVEYNPKHF